jgi:hypothetical protein
MTGSIEKIIKQIQGDPRDVSYSDLCRVCKHFFGEPRQQSSSHCIYKTPWQGDPRINIQNDKGKAKAYQVRQVLQAIAQLEAQNGNKTNNTD